MRSQPWSRMIVVQGLLSAVAIGVAYAEAPAAKWYDSTSITGYIQGMYVGNFSKDTPQQNQLRVFDPNMGFGLPQAQLKVSKPVEDDSAGFILKLLAGTNAGSIHSAGLGSDSSFDIEEANMTFNVPRVKGLQLTGGKFVTNCGVEVIESPSNVMINQGLLFYYGMPFTETGAKLSYAVSDKLSVMGGVVNGWDQVIDGNPGKTIVWGLSLTPPVKGLTAGFQGSYGPELFNSYPTGTASATSNLPASGNLNISKRTHTDFVVGFSGIDKLTLNAEWLWGQDSNTGGVADSATTPWQGAGLWASYALSDFLNPGVRFEVFNDQHGANRLSSTPATPINQTAKDFALVNKFVINKNTALRLQYEHDWSNMPVYTRSDASLVRTQNTISLDWVVTF